MSEQGGRLQNLLTSELAQKIRKRSGEGILTRASSLPPIKRIPTGVFPMDWATGGGIPVGRFSMFYGPKGSSKTSTALRAVANAQKMCARSWLPYNELTGEIPVEEGLEYREPVVALLNVEQSWDPTWAEALGVDTDRLLISEPSYGEEAVDIGEALIASGEVDVLVLDSIAFMVPTKEIEESASKTLPGGQARLMGNLVRKWLSALQACQVVHGFKPTVIMVNQIRFKIGVMFGNPETVSGGMAPGFLNSIEVRTVAATGASGIKTDDNDDPYCVDMRLKVTKNKTGPSFREGEYSLYTRDHGYKKKGEVEDESWMVSRAEKMGLIIKGGTRKYQVYDWEFGSKKALMHELYTNKEFSFQVRTRLLQDMLALS